MTNKNHWSLLKKLIVLHKVIMEKIIKKKMILNNNMTNYKDFSTATDENLKLYMRRVYFI
jgi:hypothetical protein